MPSLTSLGRLRLSVKILLVLGSVMAAMTAMAAYVAYNGVDDLTHQAGNERIEEEVFVAQAQINAAEDQLVRDAQYLAQSLAFSEAVLAVDIPAMQTNLLLNEMMSGSTIDHVLVVDDAGAPLVMLENRRVLPVPEILEDDLLSFALLGIPVSSVAGRDAPSLVAAAPILTNTGQIVGAVQVGVRLDERFLSSINFSRPGVHLLLIDRAGTIEAVFIDEMHRNPSDVTTLFAGDNLAADASPDEKLSRYGVTLDTRAIQVALGGEVVYQSEFIYNAAGRPLSAAYVPFIVNYDTEGVLVILVDLNTLSSFGEDLIAEQVIALVVIGLVSALVLAMLAWRLIARPLEHLQQATLQIAEGDYLHRADVRSSDEVGRLAAAFNTMAGSLQERDRRIASEIEDRARIEHALRDAKDELEQHVIERTQALRDELERRTQAEQQIRAALQEKDVLLKEIHHRVKNNMQVMSSLLRLQSNYASEAHTAEVLRESQHRVHSMALVHERLYQASDLAGVSAAAYIHDLVRNLVEAYRSEGDPVTVDAQVDDLTLDIDTAIPCGLILNELVSNALKHAFPDGRAGKIRIEVRGHEKQLEELVVRDTGVGMPEDVYLAHTKSLGLQLVSNLSRQIGGRVMIERTQGTTVRVRIDG